jgi:hypothetical protein
MIIRPSYIKPKQFLSILTKVVRDGIPAYADSKANPKVIGTPDWEKFWNEELHKIVNGFMVGGTWIPGFFYYYMNYKQMSTIKGVVSPDMVDLHLELAYHIEFCKANGKNLLCAKGRRKGVSEAASTMIIDYGWRFKEGYKGGVAAGNKTYVEDFLAKWRFSDSRLPGELSVKKLTDNDNEIIAGYTIRDPHGAWKEKGTFNTIYARTMHTNPNMFKGLYLNDIISEEIGEHEKWIEFFGASKDCLMSGNKQVGTMVAFGTGGNVNKGSKDFKEVWHEAERYNFVKFLIPATRFYYYGGATEQNRQLPIESDLIKQYSPYQLIGVEDVELAKKHILARREAWMKKGNTKAYIEDLQNNPIDETEIFKKTVVNNFDINKLNEQDLNISTLVSPRYTKYKPKWMKDDKSGMIKMPLEVELEPLSIYDNQEECVGIIDTEHPRKGHRDLYSAGIDSYDQDTAKTSKSLGAMCVMIRENAIKDAMQKAPVAVISCRPARKEKFYEMCLQLAVYYNLVGNVLVDIANGVIIQYFKEQGCAKYLALRPVKFESENSDQTSEFGVRLTTFARPRMVGLMQTHILDHVQDIWFPELIHQLGNYDEIEVGSDNDLADAYGIALMQDVSCDIKPFDFNDDSQEDRWKMPEYTTNRNGEVIVKKDSGGDGVINPQEDGEAFGLLFPGYNK